VKFAVESWAPEYGSPVEGGLAVPAGAPAAAVDVNVESPASRWAPRSPRVGPAAVMCCVDGVRRIDARVWIEDGNATTPGICASYAAGVVACGDRAEIVAATLRRGLFTRAASAAHITTRAGCWTVCTTASDDIDALSLALQNRLTDLETVVTRQAVGATGADLVLVDGPLRDRLDVPGAVGYVKTHRVAYLPPVVEEIVAALQPGERTPLFVLSGPHSRFSWYQRLPCWHSHSWAGIVRCEVSADQSPADAALRADVVAATLPRFASAPHKEPRAPQNLYPIAGLERELRRRLGEQAVLMNALRRAATGLSISPLG
jgi:hypothetical protein